jgi:prepilin-type N-terminal cleavage/methylation domain-containing protein
MKRAHGFTLVELAISLAVIALLLGMLIVPLAAQVDQQRINDTRKQLDLISEAILGFAVQQGRLPCPALGTTANTTAGAGLEYKPGSACASNEGVVPWATLGMPETDAWGRRFTYRVTGIFADNPTGGSASSFTLTDGGNIDVTSGGGTPVTIAVNMVAVIVSHGKNGLGGRLPDGTLAGTATGDELENTNGNITFVSKIPEPAFDDIVVWISPNVLKSRMVAAGKLW